MPYLVKQKINRKIYVYEVKSYWDKLRKQPRQIRKYLGIWDENQNKIIPPKRKIFQIKQIASLGDVIIFELIVKKLKIEELLFKTMPEELGKIALILSFYRLRYCSSLQLCKRLLEDSFIELLYDYNLPSSKKLSSYLKLIAKNSQNFLNLWVKRFISDQALIYDITSLSTASKISLAEWGYNRDQDNLAQVNLGIVVSQNRKLPVYYRIFAGSINDVKTLKSLVEELKLLGLEEFQLILDRGFYSYTNLKLMQENKIAYLIALPFKTNLAERIIAKYNQKIKDPLRAKRFEDKVIFVAEEELKLKDLNLKMFLIYDEQSYSEQMAMFLKRLTDIEEKINGSIIKEPLDVFLERRLKDMKRFFAAEVRGGKVYLRRKRKAISRLLNRLGKLILVSNYETDWKKAFFNYREKDILEKYFCSLKNFVKGVPLRLHSEESIRGLLFILFICMIVRYQLKKEIEKKKKALNIEEIMVEGSKIRGVKINEEWRLTEISKKQREVLDIFDLKEADLVIKLRGI
jgi:transposase